MISWLVNLFILRLDSRGRVTLPIWVRARLKAMEGDELVAILTDDGLLIKKKRDRWLE